MKTWKLCLIILIACSCCKSHKNTTPAVFTNLVKRYPELYPNKGMDDYHLSRETRNNDDSLEMQLYKKDNSGNQIVVFINKVGKSYAFPMPDNSDSTYWEFHSNTIQKKLSGKTFESEIHQAFKALSLDEGWIAASTFHDFALSLLQARIVLPTDGMIASGNKKPTKSCDTTADRNLKGMYQDAMVVLGLSANTFFDYNHGRYYQFDSNMPSGSKGFKITVFREPCWVEPMYL
jgi:hypothetical protein